ncbi:thymidylate kinase [Exophiala spinifera]|uniref:Thymidylate kinase n=1 Tax=Exophiala spinifera TaxID=91928 RepID=A0A0D2BGR9_9EURO|nr:thymidylate kinase [Exophiala spinifera]KIW18203.1 thymidylate kinase [Exophiala spinifera]
MVSYEKSQTSSSGERGYMIVVEGLDRSGKSTQCQKLFERFEAQGKRARYVKFPDRTTPTGQMINSYLTGESQQDDHFIHLLFSANRWEAIRSIRQDIMDGVTVIVDRYSFSGAVYSAAKENPDLSLDWAWNPEIGLVKPDLLFFLDISSADAAKRGGYGEERYETEKMQTRVRTLFEQLFSRLDQVDTKTVDAGRTMDQVAAEIALGIRGLSDSAVSSGPLKVLGPLKAA